MTRYACDLCKPTMYNYHEIRFKMNRNCIQIGLYVNRISQTQGKLKVLKMWKRVEKLEVYEEPHGNCSQDSKL